ncbi:MAG: hypothetical protein RR758_00390 [Burkholderiaceae bacterium]
MGDSRFATDLFCSDLRIAPATHTRVPIGSLASAILYACEGALFVNCGARKERQAGAIEF